jgi:hypothetical protein
MKLTLLLILFLVLTIEGTLTRTKTKTGISTWVMSPKDLLGREIFANESEDLANTNHDPVETHPIINIMLTTDDNFASMNKNMKTVFEKHTSNELDVEEIKDMMKTFTVVWTDHPEPKKRRFIPFESILEMKYIKAEDKMVITTAHATYVTKLSPSINDSFLHRILFRLICLEYETSWLYYQILLSNGNKTIINLMEYDFFPEELAILNLKYAKHIFRTGNADQYLKQLNGLVDLLEDNGLYSELRGNTELTSLLKILRLLNVQNINFLHEVFLTRRENLFLKIMGNLDVFKGYFNLPENLYNMLENELERNLMKRLITESSYLEFKTLKHIISLWEDITAHSTLKSLFISIEKKELTLNDLNELRTLTNSKYFELYNSFKFEEIKTFLTLENLVIEKLQEMVRKPSIRPEIYKTYLECFLSQYEDISALIKAEKTDLIEKINNNNNNFDCYKLRHLSHAEINPMLDKFKDYILSYDKETLSKINYLLNEDLFDITFVFIRKFKGESDKEFIELKQQFEGKQIKPKFIQYLDVMYKDFSIKKILGIDQEIFENIFMIYKNENGEIKRFYSLLFEKDKIPEGKLTLKQLLPIRADVRGLKTYESIIENKKFNNYSENKFKALQKLLKENTDLLVDFEVAFKLGQPWTNKHIKIPKDKKSKKLFKFLNENKTLEGLEDLIKRIVNHFVKSSEGHYEWLQNDLRKFKKYFKFPLLKSEAEKLLTIFGNTSKDKTFDELVNIMNNGVVEKLLQLEDLKFQIKIYSNDYEILNNINSLIIEIAAVFFKEPFMMMIKLKNEKKGLIEKITNYFSKPERNNRDLLG